MAQHDWKLLRDVAIDRFQVAVAQARGFDLNSDLTGAGLTHLEVVDRVQVPAVPDQRMHHGSSFR